MGNRQRSKDHSAYPLLKRKPNNSSTAFNFKKLMQYHALDRGNGYAEITRNGAGDPIALTPLPSNDVTPIKVNGDLFYLYKRNGNQQRTILARNMLHIRGMGTDLVGFSLIDKAKDSLGLGMAAQRYGSRFFKNDARPGMIIQVPGTWTDKAIKNFREFWNNEHQGVDNSNKTNILEEGATVQELSISNESAQFLETRMFEIKEVANWLNLPAHMLGDDGKTSFSSLEQENQSYLDNTLDPWLVNWEQECSDKLLTERQKETDSHQVEFIRQALLRADLNTRYGSYSVGLQNGFLTRNQVRGFENLNHVEGLDSYTVQLNMGVIDSNGNVIAPQQEVSDEGRMLLLDTVARMVSRVSKSKDPKGQREFVTKQIKSVTDAIGQYDSKSIINDIFKDVI